jgi:hypothetical protein
VSPERTGAHRHSAHGRVFDGNRVDVASRTGLERFLDIADDFMREVLGVEPGEFLITDLSTLQDFVGVDHLEFAGILAKISDLSGLDVADLAGGNVLETFRKLHEHANHTRHAGAACQSRTPIARPSLSTGSPRPCCTCRTHATAPR